MDKSDTETNVGQMVKGPKDPNPELPEFKNPKALTDAEKDAKAEVLRVRAESTRNALRDAVNALVNAPADTDVADVRAEVAEALAYLAERANGRKGKPGEGGAARAPKSNVVADYFAPSGKFGDKEFTHKVGDKLDAADVFFDLLMDPIRVLSSLKRFVSTVKDVEKRVWVSYDKASRSYVIGGYGATKPKDFTAYDVEKNAADVA